MDSRFTIEHRTMHVLATGVILHPLMVSFAYIAFVRNSDYLYLVAIAYSYLFYKTLHFLWNGPFVMSFGDKDFSYHSEGLFSKQCLEVVSWSEVRELKYNLISTPADGGSAAMFQYSTQPIIFVMKSKKIFPKPSYGSVEYVNGATLLKFNLPVTERTNRREILDLMELNIKNGCKTFKRDET